ncbi:MAG: hypothetical protein U0271_41135 [Polyangiaceae bacterium]
MANATLFKLTSILVLMTAACGDDTGTGGQPQGGGGAAANGGSGGNGGSAGGDPVTPVTSCVQPGDVGNDIGVGTYCTPGGGECADQADAIICLADLGQDQWFCTKLSCQMDAECGTAASCYIDPQGSACIPDHCSGTGGAGGGGGAGGA